MNREEFTSYIVKPPIYGGLHHETVPGVTYEQRRIGRDSDDTDPGGPFCKVFTLDGNWMLSGGIVTGGDTNVTVPDFILGAVSSPPANGSYAWITATGTAVTDDDILMPGIDLSTATASKGANLPSNNTIPTASSPSGTLRISLGSWSGGEFIPAGCGNIQVRHCPGTLTYIRI